MTREQKNTNEKNSDSKKGGPLSHKRLTAILLAAGKGTRMKSPLPKVLHPVAGMPMITHIIQTLKTTGFSEIRAVVGAGKDLVEKVIIPQGVVTFEQKEQKGTAHAVQSADLDTLEGEVIILNGDHPLISTQEIHKALEEFRDQDADLAVLTCVMRSPGEFGRVVRQNNKLQAIVEVKDASQDTLKIKEVNTGAYIVKAHILKEFIPQIQPHNKQNEYYLTDLVAVCVENKKTVLGIKVSKRFAFGVNDQIQLSKATTYIVQEKIKSLMKEGVIFVQPETTFVETSVQIGAGAVIYPQNFFLGSTVIGPFTVVEPNCFLQDAIIEGGVQIKFGSHIEKAYIKQKAQVGPYARIRPETIIGEEAKVGNFVEMKKVKFGKRSKASHLAYLGDAQIGDDVNIGCGTITCNYSADKKKYETIIEDGVFVGSDSQFVAPVKVGKNAIIGSGSTITKDVPEDALAIARGQQRNIEGYSKRVKK